VRDTALYIFAMNKKGLVALQDLADDACGQSIRAVIGARDANVQNDFY
jgi:hypothetical protein